MNRVIAIVGMSGSGKSVASDYIEKRGYDKVYFGGVTMKKLQEENLEVTPNNEKIMREKLRQEYGMGAIALLLLPEIEEKLKTNNVVLDGLYSWDEYKILKKRFPKELTLIAIIDDKAIRYERLTERTIRPLTNKEAEERDIAEIENLAKGGPIAFADYFILNNYTIEEYGNNLNEILNIIEGKNI